MPLLKKVVDLGAIIDTRPRIFWESSEGLVPLLNFKRESRVIFKKRLLMEAFFLADDSYFRRVKPFLHRLMLQPKPKSLTPKGGNDRFYTPQPLANKIVEHFSFRYVMSGNFLEPCLGQGAFVNAIKASLFPDRVSSLDWCEIDKGVDFLTKDWPQESEKIDWTISNFPFSKYREFLKKSMAISDNVITLSPVNHVLGMKARRRDIKEAGFFVREICELDTPKEFPQSGFQWAAIYLSRNNGLCEFTNLDYSCRNFLPTKTK